MRTYFLKSMWEMTALPFEERLRRIKAAGYDGFELNVQDGVPDNLPELLDKYRLVWAAQMIHNTVDEFQKMLQPIVPMKPLRIVLHGGRDHFSNQEGAAFLTRCLMIEREIGIPIAHETHRYRLFYSPFVTRDYLRMFPEIKLNADLSHWCVVTESLLEENDDVVELATDRAVHIHARVGFQEGPQVSDPRAPEFAEPVRRHESWWDMIRGKANARGDQDLTVVPEYGPAPYLPALPYTQQPVADVWDICKWQMERLRKMWNL